LTSMLTNITAGPPLPNPGGAGTNVTGADIPESDLGRFAPWLRPIATLLVLLTAFSWHLANETPWVTRMYDTYVRRNLPNFRTISNVFVSMVFVCMLTYGGNTYMPFITRVSLWAIMLYVAWYNTQAEGKLFLLCSMFLLPVVTSSIDYPYVIICGRWVLLAITLVLILIRIFQGRVDGQNALTLADWVETYWYQICEHAPLGKYVFQFMVLQYLTTLSLYLTNMTCWTDEIIPKWLLLFVAIITYFLMFRDNPYALAVAIAAATMLFHIPNDKTLEVQWLVEKSWNEFFKKILFMDFFDFKPTWILLCKDVTYLQAVNRATNAALIGLYDEGIIDAMWKCGEWQYNSIRTTYIMVVSVVFLLMQKIGVQPITNLEPSHQESF